MDQRIIFYTILAMALVTYIPRVLPVLFLASRSLPEAVIKWLNYIPAAVISAMLIPLILIDKGQISFEFENFFLWAAVPTFIVGRITKNLFASVITGMIIIAAGRYFFSS